MSAPTHHCRCWIDIALRRFLSQSCVSLASRHSSPPAVAPPPRPHLCQCLVTIALLSLLVSLSFSCRRNLSEALSGSGFVVRFFLASSALFLLGVSIAPVSGRWGPHHVFSWPSPPLVMMSAGYKRSPVGLSNLGSDAWMEVEYSL